MNLLRKIFNKKNKRSKSYNSFVEGDIFFSKIDNQYFIYKLLVYEATNNCYHVLSYTPLETMPNSKNIRSLKVFSYHAPIDKNGFNSPVFITNTAVKSIELVGYHEYLRQTQSPEFYVSLANNYYKTAYQLTNKKKHLDAIDEYSKAIDLFPQFFEAIDNRAFIKMDLGLFKEAIKDFELSLIENPNSMLAEFSIGECYFKMKDYDNAKKKFEIAHQIEPENQGPIKYLKQVNAIINKR